MPFKIRVGDEILNSNDNLVGVVLEERSDSYLVDVTTEDQPQVWSKSEAKGWRQTKSNKAIDSVDKKAAEKPQKSKGASTQILYRQVAKRRG